MEKKRGLSQEGLKLIACLTMLVDHIGATMVPGMTLRIIGRIAFPIFCFALAEGAHYTKNPKAYAFRLAIGAALSELPFDLALFGGVTMSYQNVMFTMLLGFGALLATQRLNHLLGKCLVVLPFALAAELLMTDYGGSGVLLIALFGLTREMKYRLAYQLVGMILICGVLMPGATVAVGGLRFGVELFAVFALVPIALYSGRKRTHSKAVQWGFYLFYPLHLTVLALL